MKSSWIKPVVFPSLAILTPLVAVLVLTLSPGPERAQVNRGPEDTPSPLTFLAFIAGGAEPTVPPGPTATPDPTGTPLPSGWLAYVNAFRNQASLPALSENPDWSYGDRLHAQYMVKNDIIGHSEDPANPWYTPEGDAAAGNSNVMVSSNINAPDEAAIDLWMTGPFHAVGILDPQLAQTGFGSYREAVGTWRMGAALDVLQGLGGLPPGVTFPVMWPGDGASTWLMTYNGNESPDPLTSCPGYSPPSGLPLILQLGAGDLTPGVTSHGLIGPGGALDHCLFDETSYTNPNGSRQSLGRSVLNMRDAVVLIPRAPLIPGETYTVSITAEGVTHSWSFSTAPGSQTRNRTLPYGQME
jgi:uncharacterized protein YkwD